MARKTIIKSPVPSGPEMWLEEIAMTFTAAKEVVRAGLEPTGGSESAGPWQLAPLFCLSARGIRQSERSFVLAAGTAFENFTVNYSPEEAAAMAPVLAFSFCYLGAHLGLGLVSEDEANKVIALAEEQLDHLNDLVARSEKFVKDANLVERMQEMVNEPTRDKKKAAAVKKQAARGSEKNAGKIYIIEISLLDIEPRIWRRVAVPGEYTLGLLHMVLQGVFEWDDSHLHEFKIGKKVYGHYFEDEENFGAGDELEDESQYRLCDLIARKGRKFYYLYDFGDSWDHELVVTEIVAPEAGVTYPVCLAAERAAPPEDSGGAWGYRKKLELLKNPEAPGYEEIAEWMGKDYDSEAVDLEAINKKLRR